MAKESICLPIHIYVCIYLSSQDIIIESFAERIKDDKDK